MDIRGTGALALSLSDASGRHKQKSSGSVSLDFHRQINSKRFEGELFCRALQATVVTLPKCAGCNAEVERKVVEFCQARPERFGRKGLCRMYQTQAA